MILIYSIKAGPMKVEWDILRTNPTLFNEQMITKCIFFLFHFLASNLVQPQFIQPGLCEIHCLCHPEKSVVDCNHEDKLQGVPTNIGRDVTKLYIQDGDFPAPSILTRANMSGLEQLEHLSIIYCKLQAIESKTFLGMNHLQHLDLSRNSLRQLDAYSFFGLQLINLYLQEQHDLTEVGLNLNVDTFSGLAADQINLRGNKLSKIKYTWFSNVNNLHRLILSDNRITQLGTDFSKHFNGPSYLLDLTANRLECSCDLVWIALLSATWADSLPGVNLTCIYQSSTHDFRVVELRRLSADHLCPRSRIQHIDVTITDMAKRAILDCTAITMPKLMYNSEFGVEEAFLPGVISHSPPEVAWQYIEGGHLREVRRLPKEPITSETQWTTFPGSSSSLTDFPSSTVRLNVSLNEDTRQYKCTTRNKQAEAEQVVVALRGPSELLMQNELQTPNPVTKVTESSSTTEGSLEQTTATVGHRDFLSRPRFSPIEMIVAVCGTFIATSVLLFVSIYLWHRCTPSCRVNMLDISDKSIYQTNTMSPPSTMKLEKSYTPTKQNGLHPMLMEDRQTLIAQQAQQAATLYPSYNITGLDTRIPLSPQFAHLSPALNCNYLPPNFANLHQSFNVLDAGDHQASLSQLVSTNTLGSAVAAAGLLSPSLPGLHPQLSYWPGTNFIPQASHYSVANSPEYDIPRQSNLASPNPMGTIHNNRLTSVNPDNGINRKSHLNNG